MPETLSWFLDPHKDCGLLLTDPCHHSLHVGVFCDEWDAPASPQQFFGLCHAVLACLHIDASSTSMKLWHSGCSTDMTVTTSTAISFRPIHQTGQDISQCCSFSIHHARGLCAWTFFIVMSRKPVTLSYFACQSVKCIVWLCSNVGAGHAWQSAVTIGGGRALPRDHGGSQFLRGAKKSVTTLWETILRTHPMIHSTHQNRYSLHH